VLWDDGIRPLDSYSLHSLDACKPSAPAYSLFSSPRGADSSCGWVRVIGFVHIAWAASSIRAAIARARCVPTAARKVWVGVYWGLPPHQLRQSGACAPAVPRRTVRRVVLREMSAICPDARSPSVEVLCTNEGTVFTVCGSGRSIGCVDRAKPRVRPRRTSAVGCGPEASLKLRLGSSMGISTRCMVERWCATRLGARCSVPCWTAALHDTCPHCGTTPCDVRTFAAGRAAGACACHPPLLWLVRTHGGGRLRSFSRRLMSGAGSTPVVLDSRLASMTTSCEG